MGQKKFFFLVLTKHGSKIVYIMLTMKYFSFPIKNIFLNIISSSFRRTEIFHCFRNFISHFLTQTEIMINAVTACNDNSCIVSKVNSFKAEFFCRNSFHMKEGYKVNFKITLFGKLYVGRFFGLRLGLGN